ncbi:hypothetical protein H6P81_001529 [Aristolochia fimbriata]|uniref:ferric-chelate reductase (NADH) n=1 Tax=Aristolochia fimbriata TaxID=158543 RepID=A0AAV7FB13_ARIFI|nr:hypothetical protein H6P81_001529 [Aristolochia fimbriata]
MAELSAEVPLLSSGSTRNASAKQTAISTCFAKWVVKFLMWAIFVSWATLIFFMPSEFVTNLFHKWIAASSGTVFGVSGSILVLFSLPILLVAFLAIIYVAAFPKEYHKQKKFIFASFRLWTFPIVIDGPFGVVSAAELIGILLFAAYVLWAISAYTLRAQELISKLFLSSLEKSCLMLEVMGLRLGSIGLYCIAFLFLPVTRGSMLLRVIDIPFEHAAKYHIWLGHLTMVLFTVHGLCYAISWALQGHLVREMLEWRDIGVANFAGVISLFAGLLMWVTSLKPVRKHYFELFFYTHQLYVVFVVFLALHVGDFIFSIAAGPIFLFLLDRFLRFCQSRATVDVISAKCLPCGTVELVFSKPPNMKYNALSFIFLQVRELSWLQWHPFSVSSSPLDGKRHVSVLIKVLGEWTKKLRDSITNFSEQPQKGLEFGPHTHITASVEGPYGHESAYHLMYENLILVAGGIGISPFLAILRDILHRINEKRPYLPKKVLIIWAVKKSEELSLLSVVDVESICPSYSDKMNLNIQTYVTQESEPPLEDGISIPSKIMGGSSFTVTKGNCMSNLVGTGNIFWSGSYLVISTLGFIIFWGLMEAFYIKPYGITSWWFHGLLFVVCMVSSVLLFGGLVILLWHYWENRNLIFDECIGGDANKDSVLHEEEKVPCSTPQTNIVFPEIRKYGCRPDFKAIFDSVAACWGHVDVGVMVCGPPNLQSSVARECRSQSLKDLQYPYLRCRLAVPISSLQTCSTHIFVADLQYPYLRCRLAVPISSLLDPNSIMGFPHLHMRSKTQNPFNLKVLLLAVFFGFLLLFVLRSSLFSSPSPVSKQPLQKSIEGHSSCPPRSSAPCDKISAPLAQALIHYSTSKITPQQTLGEISVTAKVLEQKSPCNFLVFGLGHDSLMWSSLNFGGRTVFLEEDRAWIEQVTSKFPSLEAYHVEYSTKVRDAEDLMKQGREEECRAVGDVRLSKCPLALKGVPSEIYEVEWDLIMVDAPTGYFKDAPGRMGAIWTAGMVARNRAEGETDVFVHDVDRKVEDRFSMEFWCEGYLREQQGRLRHFTIPSHRGSSTKPFCP